jgi:hypothetical protein
VVTKVKTCEQKEKQHAQTRKEFSELSELEITQSKVCFGVSLISFFMFSYSCMAFHGNQRPPSQRFRSTEPSGEKDHEQILSKRSVREKQRQKQENLGQSGSEANQKPTPMQKAVADGVGS